MGRSGIRLTYEDYCAIPADGKRHEILDGEEYVSPAPSTLHQAVVLRLARILAAFCEEHTTGVIVVSPADVILSPEDIVQPDVLFIAKDHVEIVKDHGIEGAPDLAIEILSGSTRRLDEVVKRKRYEKFGVGEYWIIDLETHSAEIYRRSGGGFTPAIEVAPEGAVESPLFPGLRVPLMPLFADPRRH